MRIAFLLHRFPGLSITFILDQVTGLIERGHDVTIFASERDQHPFSHPDVERYKLLERTTYFRQPDANPVRALVGALPVFVRSLSRQPGRTLRSLNVLSYGRHAYSLRLLYGVESLGPQGRDYDVIHCHFGPAGIKGAIFREIGLLSGALVTTFHGYDVTQYPKQHGLDVYRRHLFKRGDLFMAVSEHMKKRLQALGCAEEKTCVHHVGISTDRFRYVRRSILAGEELRLLSVARLSEKKGLSYAIRAVAALREEYDLRYRIVGDGEMRPELEQLISELGVEDSVHLLGWRERAEVAELLYDAHLFLAPSVTAANLDEEGIPTSIMEAAATGIPVLSTRHSGIPELVLHGKSGWLVRPCDSEAVRLGLVELINRSHEWEQMGLEGRRRVVSQFNIETLNDRLVKTYQRLTTTNRRVRAS